jgi:hypothetical protein
MLIVYFAVTGHFGGSLGGILLAAAANAAMIGSALAVAYCICGIAIGSRIEEGGYGLLTVFLMATAYAAFVLLVLKCFFLLLYVTGGPAQLPGQVDLGVTAVIIAWGAWFVVYGREVRRKLRAGWDRPPGRS